MQLSVYLQHIIEILMLGSFILGFLCGYIYVEYRNANRIHRENEKAFKEDNVL